MLHSSNTRNKKLGVLISNLGTPDSYRVEDVKKFLKEFLWDPRVVNTPRLIWWLVLNGIILNTRPQKTAYAYEKIWTDQGSPLLTLSQKLTSLIRNSLQNHPEIANIALGMRYGTPSIEQAMKQLQDAGANQLLVIPLYPQFSYTTTASTQDEVERIIKQIGLFDDFKIINTYHNNSNYIDALAKSVQQYRDANGAAEKLVMSFHGIPQDYVDAGDPYRAECQITADLLATQLNLTSDRWIMTYQSRLGPKKWLEPYTDLTLEQLAQNGTKSVQVICPGFSIDCLETLEEIAITNREVFINAGGQKYEYIPCLNATSEHVALISDLIKNRGY